MESVEKFCKNPTEANISKLNPQLLKMFYDASKKVMEMKAKNPENKKLNVEVAQIVINFKENKRYQCLKDMSICEEIIKDKKEPYLEGEFLDKYECYHNCVTEHKESFRVRTILPHISYTQLNKDKLLPSKPMFTQGFSDEENKIIKIPTRGGKYPKLAKKVGYPFFGMFMDMFIRTVLTSRGLPSSDIIYDVYKKVCEMYQVDSDISVTEIAKEIEYFNDIAKWILKKIKKEDDITVEPEWQYHNVQGHPDLIVNDTIYDIKTTGAWGRMRSETILQVLSYYCLGKVLRKGMKKIGVILPCQKMIISVDLTLWKWKNFWKVLIKGAENIKPPVDIGIQLTYMFSVAPYVGNHIEKFKGKIWKTVQEYNTLHLPLQIFVSPSLGGDITETESDVKKARSIIDTKKIKLFIHAPYVINLCREEGCLREKVFVGGVEKKCKYDDWIPAEQLKRQLRIGNQMNSKGVVVHLGKKAGMDISIAVAHMFNNIVDAATEATIKCPLLLETGAGTEVLSDVNDFINFYTNLPEETKRVTKICMDTCHVFASGYMPFDALQLFIKGGCPIGLIHFNDSKHPFNSKKDRHYPVGNGMIPFEQLLQVGVYAVQANIPLIYE